MIQFFFTKIHFAQLKYKIHSQDETKIFFVIFKN